VLLFLLFLLLLLLLLVFCWILMAALGKFSINCYSSNFMHESCLKGKMPVDRQQQLCLMLHATHMHTHTLLKCVGGYVSVGVCLKLRYSKVLAALTMPCGKCRLKSARLRLLF